jgi:UDPglucose--hexose-1-phosphate uridylyltransferase
MASFGDISAAEIKDLARVLRDLRPRSMWDLRTPTLILPSAEVLPITPARRHFHCYVSVIPRLTRAAGFELGSGMSINTVLPEAAA